MQFLKIPTILIAMSSISLFGDEPLQSGDAAPRVVVTTHQGEELDLGALYDEGPVALFFYPKSFTGGCTKQVCNVRDNYSDLKEAGVTVLGVSTDDVKKQEAFVSEYKLPYTLIADKERTLGKAFKVGNHMGLMYKRQTFLVVGGKVVWRDLKASPSTQTEEILEALNGQTGE
jgi:peroxiredoxin Q/BCP